MFESNDTFVEEAVKVIETAQDKTKKTAATVITLILLVSLVTYSRGFLTIIMAILLIAMAIYTIILYSNKNIEYEYDYTNGSLEIAKIINNEKRKKVVNVESSVLTTATTAVGVVPMIIAQSSFWMPVGVTIFAGGIGSLIMVVMMLPVVYWKVSTKK